MENTEINNSIDKSKEAEERAAVFGKMILPTIIYTLAATFFIYDNLSGILMTGFGLATIWYCRFMEKEHGRTLKKSSRLYEAVILLLGISTGLTGNEGIISFNVFFMALLVIVRLLHNEYRDGEWTLTKYLGAVVEAMGNAVGALPDLFQDAAACLRNSETNTEGTERSRGKLFQILLGLVIAIPLLAVILWLLMSADIVFQTVIRDTFRLDTSTVLGILFTAAFLFVASYCGIRSMFAGRIREEMKEGRRYSPVAAITALSLVAITYLVFSGIQILYLFLKNMTLPEGYTYAEYAREGFFQLLAVSMLNVLLVLFTMKMFEDSRILKILLMVISFCTYIMIASGALRMLMYIDTYHLTRKRILVLWALFTIALLFVGILFSIFQKRFPLVHYGMTVFCLCYLVLSFTRMDAVIAAYNLREIHRAAELDRKEGSEDGEERVNIEGYGVEYLGTLSTDAAPYLKNEHGVFVLNFRNRNARCMRDSFRQWNLSHALAKPYLEAMDPEEEISLYVKEHRKRLLQAAEHCLKEGRDDVIPEEGIELLGVYENTEAKKLLDSEEAAKIVRFTAPSSAEQEDVYSRGFYYSWVDLPCAVDSSADLTEKNRDEWTWKDDFGAGRIVKIEKGWYYYELSEER